MRIFKDMELVEQLGSGIPRVLQAYGKECFKFSDNYVRMSFPKEQVAEQVDKNVTENITESVTESVAKNRHIQIINLMLKEPSITTEQLAAILKVTKRTIIRNISQLKEENIITRIGSARNGYWKVNK